MCLYAFLLWVRLERLVPLLCFCRYEATASSRWAQINTKVVNSKSVALKCNQQQCFLHQHRAETPGILAQNLHKTIVFCIYILFFGISCNLRSKELTKCCSDFVCIRVSIWLISELTRNSSFYIVSSSLSCFSPSRYVVYKVWSPLRSFPVKLCYLNFHFDIFPLTSYALATSKCCCVAP